MAKKKPTIKSVLADFRALNMNDQQAFFRALDFNERQEFANTLILGEFIKIPWMTAWQIGNNLEVEIAKSKIPKKRGNPARDAEILRLHRDGKEPVAIGRTDSVKGLNRGKPMSRQAVENVIEKHSA